MRRRPLEFIAILYLVVWTISPPLQIGMLYRIAALGCAGILFWRNGFALKRKHGNALLFCFLVALNVVIRTRDVSKILSQIGLYMLFVGYVMNYWYEEDWDDFTWIVPITLLILAYWNFRTVSVIATNPNAARAVVRNDETANALLMQGVGGYALMYCQVMIVPVIVSWIMAVFRRNQIFFGCGILWAISFVRYLADAGYSIAIAASAIGVIVLFAYKRRSVGPAIAISVAVLGVALYLIVYNDAFRGFLLSIFDGTKVAKKIMDITSTATTDETAGSIASRMLRYQASIRTMLRYPLIGSWWAGGAGGHSAMLDAFAQYGFFGGLMMWRMVYAVPTMWKRRTHSPKMMRTINATIITISFIAWLDTLPFNLMMTLMVIQPIILSNLEAWSEGHEHFMDREPDTHGAGRYPSY